MHRRLKVLGKAQSINVAKVMWACAELRLDVEREDWGAGYRDTTAPAFLKLNPNVMVPVLVDGDFVLWESNTILRYLANAYGDEVLYPRPSMQRALVDQWLDWQASDLNGSWRYAFTALVRRDSDFDSDKEIRRSRERWKVLMQVLEHQLERTQAYVSGDKFTLADIPIGLSVLRWRSAMARVLDLPNVEAYFERLSARPAFVQNGIGAVV